MPTVHVVYADESRVPEYFACQDYALKGFQAAGTRVIEEAEFLRHPHVPAGDILIGFFLNDHNAATVFSAVEPRFRWTYAIDERATPDGLAYQPRIDFCKRHDVSQMVVTYKNEQHLRSLQEVGIGYVTMPCCVPRRRPRTEKPHGIFAVGTFDPASYKTRFRVRNLLAAAEGWSNRVVHMYIEPAVGEKHHDALEQHQLGIVCRADFRDRMVPKYVEFGMCHVLPVGDCPTYMPDDMKRLMVNVEGMSDKQIVDEVRRLLASPAELYARQEAYSELVHQRYDLLTNAQRVISEISQRC